MAKVSVRFWGVRGSTPVASRQTVKYGGNTACVEIHYDDTIIICDAGTGIQFLGKKMAGRKKKVNAFILLSHLHWDHISGLPFFKPLYHRKNSFTIIGSALDGRFEKILNQAISPPYFPVSLKNVPASVKLKGVSAKPFRIGKIRVTPLKLNHPGGALGWRFDFPDGKSLVYVSDNEPTNDSKNIINWAKDADIMIHDAQYSPSEYRRHKGWGHSPYTYPLEIAAAAGVKKLILSHFDPEHTDAELDRISAQIKKLAIKNSFKFKYELARETS